MKNQDKKILLFVIATIFTSFGIVTSIFNGTHSIEVIDEKNDGLIFNCTDISSGGEEVECSIFLNSNSIITQGLVIKYSFPENVEYVEFVSDSFEIQTGDANGAVLVNLDGVSGENISVGKLKLKLPNNVLDNDMFKIELIDSTIGDGIDTVIELEDVFDEIIIKSDINTLDSISLSSGKLNEIFDKNTLEYTVTTDVDKITINAVATDEGNATISGDIDVEKELHYGTNIFNIVVTGALGSKRTYKVNVFRSYDFNSDKYLYIPDDNFIYVGPYSDNLLENIDIDNSLNKKIEDDKLIISYEDERILEIKIFSINFDKYKLLGDYTCVVYFDSSISVEQFLDNTSFMGVSLKMFDSDDNEKEMSEIIMTGDVLSVYIGNVLVDDFQFSILGDSSGDGISDGMDLAQFRKHLVGWENPRDGTIFEIEGIYLASLDLNKDELVDEIDLAVLRKKIVGLI